MITGQENKGLKSSTEEIFDPTKLKFIKRDIQAEENAIEQLKATDNTEETGSGERIQPFPAATLDTDDLTKKSLEEGVPRVTLSGCVNKQEMNSCQSALEGVNDHRGTGEFGVQQGDTSCLTAEDGIPLMRKDGLINLCLV